VSSIHAYTLQGHSLGDFLRDRRQALGLSQQQVATAMGISLSRYSAIEMGQLRRIPPPSQLHPLAQVVGCTPSELLTIAGYSLLGEEA